MNVSQCSIFRELSLNLEYHILSAIKAVICVAGAFGVAKQWKQHGVRFLVHENTKILFRFFFSLNILISLMFGSIHIFELIRLRYDCFLLDFRNVLLSRGVGASSIFASQHVILVLSLERLYSAIFPAHFEKTSSKTLSVVLGLTAVLGTYTYCMMKFSDNFRMFFDSQNEVALLNAILPENKKGFKDLIRTMAISNFVSLVMLCIDLYLNFLRKPDSSSSLAISYQCTENRRILLILLPIELTQTLIGIVTAFVMIIHKKLVTSPSSIEQQLFLELVSTMPICFPLILTYLINRSVKRKSNRIIDTNLEVDHFEALRKTWEK